MKSLSIASTFNVMRTKVIATALGLLMLAGSTVRASPTVTARLDGFDPGAPVHVDRSVLDPYLIGPGTDTREVAPGRFTFTRTGGDFAGTLVGATPQFYAFCIEPLEFIYTGFTYTFDLKTLELGATNIGGMGLVKADLIRELFYQRMPDLSAVITNEKASALNVAIWEIVRENPSNALNIYSGDASFASFDAAGASMLALAQTYVSTLTGTGPRLDNLYALTIDGVQDVLVQVNSVPEPSTFLGMGGALIGVAALIRRRQFRAA